MRISGWLLLSLSSIATSSPFASHTVHEKRDALPVAWTKHSRASKDAILPVRIGLSQRNLEHADKYLEDVSDPDSPNFGRHWTVQQVANVFAPHPESSDLTLEWLHASGIDNKRTKHSVGMSNAFIPTRY